MRDWEMITLTARDQIGVEDHGRKAMRQAKKSEMLCMMLARASYAHAHKQVIPRFYNPTNIS